ncbi:hypothetical protein TL16_g07797 [Triparma laevis f. inornata]|uniref:WW domain-containing protein n=1 Tax=Triparma laevis f. inornata TaxID=1714386 RepID=A0A9W7EHT1_9STRA|nr:hypothetical protein TL16_g07797 [Triparma laevis f. inornata]
MTEEIKWVEMATDEGTPFYVNEISGETTWSMPKGIRDERKNTTPTTPGKSAYPPKALSTTGIKRPTKLCGMYLGVKVQQRLADIKHERSLLSREKEELEKLRAVILQLKQGAITPSSVSVKFAPDTAIPSAPKTAPPQNRRSSAILGKSSAGLTIADGFSTTQNTRDNHGINPGSNVSPGYEVNGKSLHTAHSSKSLPGKGKQKNKSNFAKKHKGPTLAKAFFPEKQGCDCCHGYIYGCDEMVCQELGKCICSLEEGEGTGDVKKKKGKYEFLKVHDIKGEVNITTKLRMTFGDNQGFSFTTLLLDLPSKIPSAKTTAKFIFKWPYICYLHFIRFAFGNFQDTMLASSSERIYLAKRFGVDQEEGSAALGLLAWRKSALLVLMVLSLVVLQTDIYRIMTTQEHWLYDELNKDAPTYHGLSGFPPRDILDDYISWNAQIFLNSTKPTTWTTTQGLWRLEMPTGQISNLCLSAEFGINAETKSMNENPVLITECSRQSQWLHGSDKVLFMDDEQMMLRVRPGWWTTDTLIKQVETEDMVWRDFEGFSHFLEAGTSVASFEESECEFLSIPTSVDFWPSEDIKDYHKSCIKMKMKELESPVSISAKYNIENYRYDRFSAYVGFTSLLALKNEVIMSVYVDDVEAVSISCMAKSKNYSWNGTVPVINNFCTYNKPNCEDQDLPYGQQCDQPFQAVDVLLPINARTLELRAHLPSATSMICDGDVQDADFLLTLCDGLDHVGWGSPMLHSNVRAGEEPLMEYSKRIISQAKSEILYPSYFPTFIMNWALLIVNLTVLCFLGWSIKWWTTYKQSRYNLGMAWLFCFVGPLAISCVPLRLTMDWNVADHMVMDYTRDLSQRYQVEHRQQQVINVCEQILNGNVNAEMESQIDLRGGEGGAMEWAAKIAGDDWVGVDQEKLKQDLEWVNPYNFKIDGFPSTCHGDAGETLQKTCTGNGVFDGNSFPVDGPPPCECGANCDMVGYCKFDHPTAGEQFVSCKDLIPKLNCTDMHLLTDSCSCSCAAASDTSTGANKYNLTKAEERCKNGFVNNFVPMLHQGPWRIPIVGDLSFSTYKIHWYCGEARGYMYESKYEMALEKSKEGCRELMALSGGSDIWESESISSSIEDGMKLSKKLSSTSLSYDHAMDMMMLALPAALSIGPGLMIGSLRAKTMVPQAASAGMFVVLLPWLYAPVVWCLFNFAFQFAGNFFILPGLMLLAFVPMTYFIIGTSYNITRPLSKGKVKGLVKWGARISNSITTLGMGLLCYGIYYAYWYDETNESFRFLLHNLWDGYLENDQWEWVNLLYLLPPVINTLFKYFLTTVLGVDFIMYELIHQRMYEIFLDQGIEGVMQFSAVKPRHFDYTPEQTEEMSLCRIARLNAFSKLIAAPTRLDEVDKAIKRKRKKKMRESAERVSNLPFLSKIRSKFSRGASSFGSASKSSGNKSGRNLDDGPVHSSKTSLSSGDKSLSTFAGEDSTVGSSSSRDLDGKKKKRKHMKKKKSEEEEEEENRKFRIWDVIDEGQPGVEYTISNFFNHVSTTLLHLKRSRSKLMESKRMASQQEIDYLSATHGLTFNKDSSLCFELITWRRSSLWVLVIFGVFNIYFGTMSYLEARKNFGFDNDLATIAPLHRFPEPKYMSQAALDHWALTNPDDWTLYYGALSFNYSKADTLLPKRRYFMGITDGSAKQTIDGQDDNPMTKPGGTIGLVSRTFSYGNDHDRFSMNVNGTMRNAKGYCVEIAEDELGTEVTVEDCAADFLGYDTENTLLDMQTWYKGDTQWSDGSKAYQLKTKGGHCLGVAVTEFCENRDDMCIRWANQGLCVVSAENDDETMITVREKCPKACGLCSYDSSLPNVKTDTQDMARPYDPSDPIDLTLVPCINRKEKGTFGKPEAMFFNFPTKESFQARLDWKCNGPLKTICSAIPDSHVNMDMTLKARFDLGNVLDLEKKGEGVAGLVEAPVDYLWRCYSIDAMVNEGGVVDEDGTLGGYDYEKQSWAYCNRHNDLKKELEGSLGIELFSDYSKRMIGVAFTRMKTKSNIVDEVVMILILLLDFISIVISIVALQLYSSTFLGPFISTIIPLRMFLDWNAVDSVANAWAKEFDDEYGTESKEQALISACTFFVDDVDESTLLDRVLDICGEDETITAEQAEEWGDTSIRDDPYKCTDTYLDRDGNRQNGYGYPLIRRDPCRQLNGKGSFLQGVDIDVQEICEEGSLVPDLLYEGLIPRLLSVPGTNDPIKIDIKWFYPLDQIAGKGVYMDMSDALIQCGRARKMICGGEYEQAIKYTKQACQEALDYLDGDDSTNAAWVESNVAWNLARIREAVELSVCGSHAITTFKKMIGATFALAPALIRSALKVKTAVPQSPMTGMFIIVLPWLYSPLVWVVFNVVFQLIGNWQLLVGLIAFSFGPMAFFVFGITKNVTRPFDDKEAKSMVRFFEFTQGLKVGLSGVFVCWGLYEFSFRENNEYFGQYKQHVFSGLGALQLASMASTMAAKYYYTTIVGVDYMLAQIMYARKHEVLMSVHAKSDLWGTSTHAKLAAEIHKDYVKLLNFFCKIQDKQDREDAWADERDHLARVSRGMSVEEWKGFKDAKPPPVQGAGWR